jgi:proton-dependent oligopeptide transporter, POT family
LRKNNIRFSAVSRITVGFILVSLAMAWTALVQHMIYTSGPNYDYPTKPCPSCQSFNNISGAWQIPAYFLVAVSEIFASITGLEYAFTKAPASMKSVVMSLYLLTSAFGSALNSALLPVTVDPKLMWMYAALSIMSLGVGILFFLLFRNDEEKQTPE